MKQSITYLFVLLVTIALTSCEKVVDVPLREGDKKYVIEGVITDQAGRTQVRISQTKSFSGSNDFEGINAESVSISEEDGTTTFLSQKATGIYESDIKGTPGKRYTLRVMINGTEYTAVSQMPMPVSIDSLYLTEMGMGSTSSEYVNVRYNDPLETGNYYHFVQYTNGTMEKHINTRNDDLSNGRLTSVMLFTNDDRELQKGDCIKVELQSIDAAVYKYWYSLDAGADGSPGATPANPETNLSGGALGYFSAHTVREKMMIVE
jgi:hypothetical protein